MQVAESVSEKKKVLFIFGTRPEAIKMAPIINKLYCHPSLRPIVCVTGQHRQMLDQVLDIFSIKPDYDLKIMKKNQTLFDITANVLISLEKVIEAISPNILLVQGDTTTTFVGALAGFYKKIPVGHVEAGLRTFNKYSPFPEEMNRSLTTHIADLHFAPTKLAFNNLTEAGVNKNSIFITGNTVIDALLYISRKLNLEELYNGQRKIILVTGHRRENFGARIKNICLALKEIAKKYSNVEIVYPVHLNPNIQEPVYRIISGIDNIKLIDPVDYLEFVKLMHKSYLILTDSGGVQEEAPSLGKPVLVMRDDTERPEGIQIGTARLIGTDRSTIVEEVSKLLNDKEKYKVMSEIPNPYGDGKASERIVNILEDYFGL